MPPLNMPGRGTASSCMRSAFLAAWGMLCLVGLFFGGAHAQEAGTRLMDQAPFDLLTLDRANDGKVFKISPLRLPNRRVPEKPKPTDKLRIKLLDSEEEYDVAWANIAKLELYEQLVVAEVNKFSAEGKLDDAFEELTFLLTYYPQAPGLSEARQNFLYASSAAAFRQQKFDEALAVLEELIVQNPNFRAAESAAPLTQRLNDIADRLIGVLIQKRDYPAARTLLARLAKQYKLENEPYIKKWRDQLEELATRHRDEAQQHLEAGRFVEAQDAASQLLTIWPQLPGAAELGAEIARRHPLVRVGVEHPARAFDSASLHDVAARRAGRLVGRMLIERTAIGAEGGRYESPIAQLTRSDDSLSLSFRLLPLAGPTAAYDLTQRLVARGTDGTDECDPAWGAILSSVALTSLDEVQVNFRSSFMLPEALLMVPLSPLGAAAAGATQPYTVFSRESTAARFTLNSHYDFLQKSQPAEIVERTFADPQRAIQALKRGEIDVLDRVFPGDIAGLKSDGSLLVAAYAGPTTHALAVRSPHPFLTSPTFRRALVYASNRELLLSQGLLRGTPLAGARVVSGAFPAPVTGMELPTYGYDPRIEPRPFDPRLAMALVSLAEGELKARFEKQQKQAPKLTPLLLGHPADELSRIACRGLVKDWKRIGVECKLQELPAGEFDDSSGKCDLVYLQLQAWEPIVDANRLFGPGGLASSSNEHIQLALRKLQASRNWQQARERLVALHRLVHEDVSVLPLWQITDHFAYRRSLQGPKAGVLQLYQDVERWQVRPQVAKGQP
jgi:tetratricopeptide (TPR) repeat protein